MSKILYIFLGILALACAFLYLRLDSVKNELESAKKDLSVAVNANKDLSKALNELKTRHEAELNALKDANTEKESLKERIEHANKEVFKSNETNTTKLFNTLLDRLFD